MSEEGYKGLGQRENKFFRFKNVYVENDWHSTYDTQISIRSEMKIVKRVNDHVRVAHPPLLRLEKNSPREHQLLVSNGPWKWAPTTTSMPS